MVKFSSFRAAVIMLTLGVLLVTLITRVAYLQTYGRQQTIRRAERQQHMSQSLQARRGTIFDRNGHLMAGTVQKRTVYVDPQFMLQEYQRRGKSLVQLDQDIEKLAEILDKDPFELARLLADRSTSRFVKIAEHVEDETVKAIVKLNMDGLGLMPDHVRYYPMGSLAAHVLGGVGAEGNGLEGLELQFNEQLAGRNGFKRTLKDGKRHGIAVAAEDYLPPLHGQHLILTIDANIQMIAEAELAAACMEFGAPHGEVVVMDPQSGEVLALAVYPTFNPQNLEDSTQEIRRNRVLTDPYEPGSTLKPLIVGPALAWRVTKVNEVWNTRSPYNTPFRRKHVEDVHGGYPQLATWDILVKSSNVGMAKLAERLEKAGVYKALALWGLGQPLGIELPGEDGGVLRPVNKWSNSDVISAVQGYSVLVTPLQLVRAMSAYANGGRLVKPTIIKGVLDADGNLVSRHNPTKLEMLPQALDPMTAAEVRRVLADVPVRGTASRAGATKTWNLFGKTGTAHIAINGTYSDQKYTSSFIGGGPYEDPRLVIAMVLHGADKRKGHYGGIVSAPAAIRVLERSLAYLQVPESPTLPLPPPQIASVLYNYNEKAYRKPRNVTASAAD